MLSLGSLYDRLSAAERQSRQRCKLLSENTLKKSQKSFLVSQTLVIFTPYKLNTMEEEIYNKAKELFGPAVMKNLYRTETRYKFQIDDSSGRLLTVGYFDYEKQYGELYHKGSAIKFIKLIKP
jgi:hypothetical protein